MALVALAAGGIALAQLAAEALPWSLASTFDAGVAAAQARGSRFVDRALLMALAWRESGFNAAAVGPPNANGSRDWGLMQINDANLARFNLTTETAVADPVANVRAAAELLAELEPHARNRGDLVSMYNAGQDRATGGPKIETVSGQAVYVDHPYVEDVMLRYLFVRVAEFAPVKTGLA